MARTVCFQLAATLYGICQKARAKAVADGALSRFIEVKTSSGRRTKEPVLHKEEDLARDMP